MCNLTQHEQPEQFSSHTNQPTPESPLQQQQQVLFDEIFKLPGGERMLAMYNVSIVSHSSMLLARARLFLTERHVCVDANSIFQKLTASIAWHDPS
jgi:hypothetical protein